MNLITDTDLAERFGITVDKLHELRRTKGWPCVRLSRTEFRFTDEQVEQIVAMHSQAPATPKPAVAPTPAIDGQTARSASRKRSA